MKYRPSAYGKTLLRERDGEGGGHKTFRHTMINLIIMLLPLVISSSLEDPLGLMVLSRRLFIWEYGVS